MNKLLGLTTLVPLAGLVAAQVGLVNALGAEQESPAALSLEMATALGPVSIGIGVALALLPFFLWHLLQRSSVTSTLGRVAWGLALVFLAPLSLPLYWLAELRG